MQKVLIGGLLACAVGAGLYEAWQFARVSQQNQELRAQQAVLNEEARRLGQERDELAGKLAGTQDSSEQQRRRVERLEMMSLRGQVKQLSDELRRLRAVGTQSAAVSRAVEEAKEADTILFSASLTNRVPNGQTLVVGGWGMNGMRGYLLLTPSIRIGDPASGDQPLAVQSQVVGAPEEFWAHIGWGEAKSGAHRSTIAGVLTPEQVETLLTALKAAKGSEISNTSLAKGRDGELVGIGFSYSDDRAEGALMGVNLFPRIDPKSESVDLEIRPAPVTTNTVVHPTLQPVGENGTPAAR